MENSKEYLLTCAESAAKYINEKGLGNFIGIFLDILDSVNDKWESRDEQRKNLLEILYNFKNCDISQLTGKKKNINNSIKLFINDFLTVKKSNQGYRIENKDFKNLTVKELHYVFAWTRRLIKEQLNNSPQKFPKSHNKGKFHNKKKKKDYKKSYSTQEEQLLNNPFAVLKDYFEE